MGKAQRPRTVELYFELKGLPHEERVGSPDAKFLDGSGDRWRARSLLMCPAA
jgi:hypothetical protein